MKKILPLFALCFAFSAWGERADRDLPIHIEASRVSTDDIERTQIFEGQVVLTQGTTQLRTERLVVTQDDDGFQKGVATGGPNGLAKFRQKREASNEYVEGEAERIEHDSRNEKTEFFKRAWVKNGQDEVRGAYISYEGLTEKYTAKAQDGTSKTAKGEKEARVRAIIQPKSNK